MYQNALNAMLENAAETRPRSAAELGELKAAAGVPFVIAGILDPRDAELVAKAGADAIIACSSLSAGHGAWLEEMPMTNLNFYPPYVRLHTGFVTE
jgi:NAD(P)H-dependent flavin oxidoreductase YrpB (nitropropane dioxygenase family)